MELRIFPDREELNHAAAKIFVKTAKKAVNERGKFSVALCGGNTLTILFELLAASPWIFWSILTPPIRC